MKPVHIVILIVVSIGLAIAVSFYGDTSKYVCFKEADSIAVDRPNMKLHVVTTLSKTMPSTYDPQKTLIILSFMPATQLVWRKRLCIEMQNLKT